ncbi:hypothetical protein LXL04_005213 [Taraxacum kok-saghyz]
MMESSVHDKIKGPSQSQHETLEFFNREIGFNPPRKFSRQISASEALVKRIDLAGKLKGHEGCVNTIEFNHSGDHLVSGSDDRRVMIWNVATKSLVLSYPSGHVDNIFQAKIMPFTDDRTIVTSAADGQVRLGQIAENGKPHTKKLGKHHGRVHKLAVEPGSPHIFYSCGEDGLVQHFDLRSNSPTKLFCCSPFTSTDHHHHDSSSISNNNLRLNSIIIDPRNPNFFSIAGSDKYARVYDIRSNFDQPVNTFCPKHLLETHDVHITGMAYSSTSELLVSYNDELIYLFQKNNGLGPNPSNVTNVDDLEDDTRIYSGHRNSLTVKGVSFFGPNCEYVMSGSDCGHIFIWKKKEGKLVRVMEGDRRIVNQVVPHPNIPVLASSGLEKDIKLWVPLSDDILALPHDLSEIMEANRKGREDHSRVTLTPDVIMHVLRLHRRQALAFIERRRDREDFESDEEDENDGYVMGFSDGGSLDDGNSTECNIV